VESVLRDVLTLDTGGTGTSVRGYRSGAAARAAQRRAPAAWPGLLSG